MNIIEHMGFPAYMLIVAEFINWSKDNDIPVGPGRGSAAGSIVAWSMGITDVDPLKYNLLFERFLNPERVSMPDIDIDFCQAKRKLAIEHVQKKYGKELVSQIITYGKLAARAAVKDACRILGIPFLTSNEIAKMVPEKVGIKLNEVLEDKKIVARMQLDPLISRVFTLAKKLEGTTRQVGVHAAGVVIADRPLVEHSPMYKDWKDPNAMPVIQYDMGSSETIGLIKFDFLGLKTLDQIDQTVKFVKSIHNKNIDMAEIDLTDDKTYSLLSKGDTVGVFQLESSGMQALMRSMKPQSIEDVIASIALYRPGPLSSGMDKSFVECKEDPEKIEYLDPRLEQILDTTYGSMVYQEQVMQIAQELAGYSLGEADLLRRAMGKKKKSEMEKQKIRFVKGYSKMVDFVERSSEQVGSEIFDLMAYFAGYGFNKSHSAAYGLISYQTAFLKAHYRVEYFAALLMIENDNTDKIQTLIEDCIVNDIKILPPNVNDSFDRFEPVPALNSIKYSLSAIKRIGQNSATSIFEARKRCGGRFKDFQHFLEEVDKKALNKKVIENLIKCGAFDWTGKSRACLFHSFPDAIKVVEANKSGNDPMQLSLFSTEVTKQNIEYKKIPEWDAETKAKYELEAIGFYITSHPMSEYTKRVKRESGKTILQILKTCPSGNYYTCGIIKKVKNINTRSNSKMKIITVEDETSSVEVAVFESTINNLREPINEGNGILFMIEKKLKESGKSFSYQLKEVEETVYFNIKSKKES
jgi:DNA polymerase-3 subunit alpha